MKYEILVSNIGIYQVVAGLFAPSENGKDSTKPQKRLDNIRPLMYIWTRKAVQRNNTDLIIRSDKQ